MNTNIIYGQPAPLSGTRAAILALDAAKWVGVLAATTDTGELLRCTAAGVWESIGGVGGFPLVAHLLDGNYDNGKRVQIEADAGANWFASYTDGAGSLQTPGTTDAYHTVNYAFRLPKTSEAMDTVVASVSALGRWAGSGEAPTTGDLYVFAKRYNRRLGTTANLMPIEPASRGLKSLVDYGADSTPMTFSIPIGIEWDADEHLLVVRVAAHIVNETAKAASLLGLSIVEPSE